MIYDTAGRSSFGQVVVPILQASQFARQPDGRREPGLGQAPKDDRKPQPRRDRPAHKLGALPAHLPPYEVVIDAEHSVPALRECHAQHQPSCAPSGSTSCPCNSVCASPAASLYLPCLRRGGGGSRAPAQPIAGSMIRAQSEVNLRHRRRSHGEVVRQGFARLPTCQWPMPFMILSHFARRPTTDKECCRIMTMRERRAEFHEDFQRK